MFYYASELRLGSNATLYKARCWIRVQEWENLLLMRVWDTNSEFLSGRSNIYGILQINGIPVENVIVFLPFRLYDSCSKAPVVIFSLWVLKKYCQYALVVHKVMI